MKAARILGIIVTALVLTGAPIIAFAAADSSAPVIDDRASAPSTTTPEDATSDKDVAGPAVATPEAEAPHEAAETHGEGGLPQLNIATYPSQIFWLCVMFAVLYTAFSAKVLPSIGAVVGAREMLIKGNLDKAASLKQQAETIRDDYEASLAKARRDATIAVQSVEAEAKAKAMGQMDTFRARADRDMKAAEERVEAAKGRAMGDISAVVVEASSLAAEKITGQPADRRKAETVVNGLTSNRQSSAKAA